MSNRRAPADRRPAAPEAGVAPSRRTTPRRAAATDTASTTAAALVLQAKLRVGATDDPLEAEADRLAAEFEAWRGGAGATAVSADGAPRSRRSTAVDVAGEFDVDADVEHRIERSRGGGAALPDAVRSRFEGFFGADLSGVRVHRGAESAELNRSISARAFTTGTDVFLGEGESFEGPAGEQLLAHELTHVVQQTGGVHRTIRRAGGAPAAVAPAAPAAAPAPTPGGRKKADEPSTAQQAGERALLAGNLAGTANSAMNRGKQGAEIAGAKPETASIEITGVTLGLAGALEGLFSALRELFAARHNSVGEERLGNAVEAVAHAGDLLKASCGIAVAAGAELGQLVPGVGLALSCLAFVMHLTKIVVLHRSASAASKAIDAAHAAGDVDKENACITIYNRTITTLGLNYVKLLGDVYLVIGNTAEFTPIAPLGMALKLIGMCVHLIGGFGSWIAEQCEAGRTADARAAYAAAEDNKAKDPKAFAAAKSNRLTADVHFAVHEMLELVTAAPELDPTLTAMVATYGLGPNWLQRYKDSDPGAQAAQRDEAETLVMNYLQAEKDPQTIKQKIVGGLSKAKTWVMKKLGMDVSDRITQTANLATAPLAAKFAQLRAKDPESITPGELTTFLARPYGEIVAREVAPVSDKDKRDRYFDAVDAGMVRSVQAALMLLGLPGYDLSSIEVTRGVIGFARIVAAKPAAAKASAGSATNPMADQGVTDDEWAAL